MRRVPLLLLICIACNGTDGPSDAGDRDASQKDAAEDRDADIEDGAVMDGSLPPGPGLAGILRTEDGAPLEAMVLACLATTCYFGESIADGTFYFMVQPPAEIALKTLEDLDTTPRRGAALAPVTLTDDTLAYVGSIYVPNLPAGTPFGPTSSDPQTLAAGDGLELTLNRADLTPRLGDVLRDLAARAIPPARRPAFPELGSEEVIAVYALHPFGAHSSSPIGVAATSTLAAGTTVRFRSVSELDGRMSPPAEGMADGAYVRTNVGQGIEELSWIVISR